MQFREISSHHLESGNLLNDCSTIPSIMCGTVSNQLPQGTSSLFTPLTGECRQESGLPRQGGTWGRRKRAPSLQLCLEQL